MGAMDPSELLLSSLAGELWVENASVDVVPEKQIFRAFDDFFRHWSSELAEVSVKSSVFDKLSPQHLEHRRDQVVADTLPLLPHVRSPTARACATSFL